MSAARPVGGSVASRASADGRGTARYYRRARTAHLERLSEMGPGDFLFRKRMYDFDDALARSIPQVRQVSLAHVLWRVWRGRYSTLEVVEPYAPSALPENVLIALACRLSPRPRAGRTTLVSYAIENADVAGLVAAQLPLPPRAGRAAVAGAVRFVASTHGRIAFGTSAAKCAYDALLGDGWASTRSTRTTEIPGLPSASPASGHPRTGGPVVFVGSLEERKGVPQLLEAWSAVVEQEPGARLHVLGKGELVGVVQERARLDASVTLTLDPPRSEIRATLDRACVLVLLSRPGRRWKEQIGLPILEGLSHGLEIVSTDETGIAGWLADHGHQVIAVDAGPQGVADAVVRAIRSPRSRTDITRALPERDGRMQADDWLHRA